jgi:hypothetical protein
MRRLYRWWERTLLRVVDWFMGLPAEDDEWMGDQWKH